MKNQKKELKITKKIPLIIICIFILLLILFLIPWGSILKTQEEKDLENVQLIVETEDEISIIMGEFYQIEYVTTLYGEKYENISFIPENKNIVSVSGTGLITSLAPGTTTIHIASGNKTKTIKVTVEKLEVKSIYITALRNNIPVNNNSSLYLSDEIKITAGPNDEFLICEIIYKSSDESVATINENGVITLHKNGSFTIRAEVKGNPNVYNEITLYVIGE